MLTGKNRRAFPRHLMGEKSSAFATRTEAASLASKFLVVYPLLDTDPQCTISYNRSLASPGKKCLLLFETYMHTVSANSIILHAGASHLHEGLAS